MKLFGYATFLSVYSYNGLKNTLVSIVSVSQFIIESGPAIARLPHRRRPGGVLGVLGVSRPVVAPQIDAQIISSLFLGGVAATVLLDFSLAPSVLPVQEIKCEKLEIYSYEVFS